MDVYKDKFSGNNAVKNINQWTREKTNGMIKEMLDSIDPSTLLILINTLYFESKWNFDGYEYSSHTFTDAKNNTSNEKYINDKTWVYYHSDSAKAFRVYLKDNYYFLGILPNENDIDGYLQSFNGNELTALTQNSVTNYDVYWRLPKFTYDYDVSLVNALKSMGINDVFDITQSDLSSLATYEGGNIFANDVKHKTKIELDKNGIKAGAATYIPAATSAAPKERLNLYLNRPFVYAIMDKQTNTPIFIGAIKYL